MLSSADPQPPFSSPCANRRAKASELQRVLNSLRLTSSLEYLYDRSSELTPAYPTRNHALKKHLALHS